MPPILPTRSLHYCDTDIGALHAHDPSLGTAHLGILNSPTTWQLTLDFLTNPSPRRSP